VSFATTSNFSYHAVSALLSAKGRGAHCLKACETSNFAKKNCFVEADKFRPAASHKPHESDRLLLHWKTVWHDGYRKKNIRNEISNAT
jgi:hypothetical protein